MTTDSPNHDRTTKAFERLDLVPGQFTEPTVVVTEPTVAALPYRSPIVALPAEPTAIVTETTLAALAAMTATQEDPDAKTVPFEPVTGIALPIAPSVEHESRASRQDHGIVTARGTGDRSASAHRAVERAAAERAAAERAANERTAIDPNAIERIAAERAAVERAAAERSPGKSGPVSRAVERSAPVERGAAVERSAPVERSAKASRPAPVDAIRAETQGDIKLGKYNLLRHLASGGTSHVFLARVEGPTGFSRHLVVKTLRREHASDPARVAAFVDEAWFLSSLHHSNIVQIFDVGASEDGTHYLAMDYLHGETLRAVIQQARASSAPLPLGFAITAVAACAEALHYVHTRHASDGRWLRMVHRDVTPSNLVAGYDGSVKLIDFGNAKAATRASHTPAGAIKGQAAYMAPEQARGGAVDVRSEVFSLGVVLYELTTRIHPFADRSAQATTQRLLQGEIKPPAQLVPNYPPELSRVVMTALARDPAARYSDCGALGQALMRLAEKLELRTGPTAVRTALIDLFGEKQEAWIADAVPAPQEAKRKSEPHQSAARRDKPTRPLGPAAGDRSSPLAVPQAAPAHPSGGVSAAKAAALPPAAPVVTPSARVGAAPPPRLPAASSFTAPPRPARVMRPDAGHQAPSPPPLPAAAPPPSQPLGSATLPAAPPPPAVVAVAKESARPEPPAPPRSVSARPAPSLVSPLEVQHLVDNAWGGVRPAMAADQWASAISEAREQHRPIARGTMSTPTTSAAVEITTGTASSASVAGRANTVGSSASGLRVAAELVAMLMAAAIVVGGPVLGQIAVDRFAGEEIAAASPVKHEAAAQPVSPSARSTPSSSSPKTAPAQAATITQPDAPATTAQPATNAQPAEPAQPATNATAPSAASEPSAAEPAPQAATIKVMINSEPPGALVTLDGKRLGRTPLLVDQPARSGVGALRLRLDGYRVHRAEIDTAHNVELTVRLREAPAAAPAEPSAEPVPDFMRRSP